MHFFVFCQDKPGHGAVRAANREAHLAYLRGYNDRIVAGGPTQTDDGAAMNGSVLLMDFADRAELDGFLAGDPYAQAGLFESVTVRPWKHVVPFKD